MNTWRFQTTAAHSGRVWLALVVLLVLRLVSLALYPLTDNTEARYAEIGRVMWSLGDWVTPWFDIGVPFWGKPPLSFWATASSFAIFGVNEFAARLPHYLAALGVGYLVWGWAEQRTRREAILAAALLAGSCLMLLSSGAVMTDMTLLVGITLAMRGFWLGLYGDTLVQKKEGWLFFAGLAVGLLAKGPLVLVLAGLPIGVWAIWQRAFSRVWHGLPWVRGSLLLALLVVPWYVLAELHTPGFLNYFLIGEHWHRFVTPGWAGDRYGSAHKAAHGTIWLYAGVALLPWSLVLPIAAWRWRKSDRATPAPSPEKSLVLYWFLWALAPAVFFTMAGNILWTYVLPALPAMALLGARWLATLPNQRGVHNLIAGSLWLMSALLIGLVSGLNLPFAQDWHTTRRLVTQHEAQLHQKNSTQTETPLIFYPLRPNSAAFYSGGSALQIRQPDALEKKLTETPAYLAVKSKDLALLPEMERVHLQLVVKSGEFSLFMANPGQPSK